MDHALARFIVGGFFIVFLIIWAVIPDVGKPGKPGSKPGKLPPKGEGESDGDGGRPDDF